MHSEPSSQMLQAQKDTVEQSIGQNTGSPATSDAVKPPKKERYDQRLSKMSNRQIAGEIRKKLKNPGTPRINEIFAVALDVIFKNYRAGKSMYVGG